MAPQVHPLLQRLLTHSMLASLCSFWIQPKPHPCPDRLPQGAQPTWPFQSPTPCCISGSGGVYALYFAGTSIDCTSWRFQFSEIPMNGEGRCKLFRLSCLRHLDTLICSELSTPEGTCGYCPSADTPAYPETPPFLSEAFYLTMKDKEVIQRTLSPTVCPRGLTLLNFASHFTNMFFYSVSLTPTWPGDCDLK